MRGIITICLVFIFVQGWSQAEISYSQPRILTDRSLYMAGESVRYRVFSQGQELSFDPDLSKVYYLELISPDGTSLSRVKNFLDTGGVTGLIHIPRDIASGSYYLKGYTRWMRINGPEAYSYLELKIINAGSKKVLTVDTASRATIFMQMQEPILFSPGPISAELTGSFESRSPVSLRLTSTEEFALSCCITVARKGSINRLGVSQTMEEHAEQSVSGLIPETRGVSLSGTVQFNDTGKPAPYALVYVSYIGLEKEFLCNYTDSSGRFYFTLPEGTGERELFISASHRQNIELDLYVDQDFCTESLTLPSIPLEIDSAELELISSMWINTQILDQYFKDEAPADKESEGEDLFFYGQPLTVVRFDDFIKLPTLEEYFTELTPEVSVRRSDRKKVLRVMGDSPDLEFFSPLVMLDGVAIFDMEAVLAVSPRSVDRFEIITAPYIKGNVTFGGIVNIITRAGDLGSIDLPSSGSLVRYMLFSKNPVAVEGGQPVESRIPDVRNTLYWNPKLQLFPNQSQKISFRTSDLKGEYELLIRGAETSGKFFEKRVSFTVE
jgi:hypothetical protein